MATKEITFDVVYECLTDNFSKLETRAYPSFEVKGVFGTDQVVLYASNNDTQPADLTEMQPEGGDVTASTYDTGIYPVNAQVKWIAFSVGAGTPVVKTNNIVEGA